MGRLADALAGPRVLTLDIERLPGEVTLDVWEPRDFGRVNYVHPDRWSVLPRTLCLAAKWHGEKPVQLIAAWDAPDDPWHVARTAWDLLDQADIAVTFNGDRADLKWLRSDWVQAGLALPAPYRSCDLFLIARRQFAFESKSLAHLCQRLNVPGKHGHYDAAQAKAAMAGDEKAQRALARYNRQDVRATEACFDRLRPYLSGLNYGLYAEDEARVCVNCGSDRLEPAGWAATAVTRYPSYRCQDCQSLMRGKHRSAAVPMRGVR